MKRLVGGDFLLDVSSIELEETSTLTNITDKDVISQLTNLKKFIPNSSMIKPIWVKLLDSDGKLVVTRGSLSVVDSDEFELNVILNGYTLKIHVKFTQVLNEDDDPIDDWYIATNDAKYLFTTNNFATFKVADVKNIDGEILSQLKCGNIIIKEDASGEHAYIVTYRGETGICLTYTDASVVETQSYDLVDDEWVYNSEDKTPLLLQEWDGSVEVSDSITRQSVFVKSVRNCNELQFIFNCRLQNLTNETITIATDTIIAKYPLPDEILEKIYAHNGYKLTDLSTNQTIAYCMLFCTLVGGQPDTDNFPRYGSLYWANSTHVIGLYLEGGKIDIPANTGRDFEARISLAIN